MIHTIITEFMNHKNLYLPRSRKRSAVRFGYRSTSWMSWWIRSRSAVRFWYRSTSWMSWWIRSKTMIRFWPGWWSWNWLRFIKKSWARFGTKGWARPRSAIRTWTTAWNTFGFWSRSIWTRPKSWWTYGFKATGTWTRLGAIN